MLILDSNSTDNNSAGNNSAGNKNKPSTKNSYLAFARKYRPQSFANLVGQEVLVKTLGNAIVGNKLHHAFILTGIRGVGKTTTARIIAKTINCQNLSQIDSLPICCNICPSCVAISNGNHPDVFEIDAASNTGVDDARKIIDSVVYGASMSNYKVYIIDEFHMLSKNAFNALLKTLEEPPAYVKFIFATTEINKTPNTILSRCQKFYLRSLNEEELAKHLANIIKQENIEADDRVLLAIAKAAEGSVRDALSFLDQAVATNNFESFLPFSVIETMFLAQDPLLAINIVKYAIQANYYLALQSFHHNYQYSQNLRLLTVDLLTAISDIINTKLINNYQAKSLSASYQEEVANIASDVATTTMLNLWQIVQKSWAEIKDSPVMKISYEIMLAKMCQVASLPNLQEVLNAIDDRKEIGKLVESEKTGVEIVLENFANAKVVD